MCCETAEKLRISLLQKCVQQCGSSPFQTLIGWVASIQFYLKEACGSINLQNYLRRDAPKEKVNCVSWCVMFGCIGKEFFRSVTRCFVEMLLLFKITHFTMALAYHGLLLELCKWRYPKAWKWCSLLTDLQRPLPKESFSSTQRSKLLAGQAQSSEAAPNICRVSRMPWLLQVCSSSSAPAGPEVPQAGSKMCSLNPSVGLFTHRKDF